MSPSNQNKRNMMSRLSIMEQLKELKNYRFVAYHDKVMKGMHRVSLCVQSFEENPILRHQSTREFYVIECNHGLQAMSVCGRLHIEKLS